MEVFIFCFFPTFFVALLNSPTGRGKDGTPQLGRGVSTPSTGFPEYYTNVYVKVSKMYHFYLKQIIKITVLLFIY